MARPSSYVIDEIDTHEVLMQPLLPSRSRSPVADSLHGGHLDEQSLAHLVQVDADETSDAVAMNGSV